MPYRCQTCTKTLTEGSLSCGSCGKRFSVPVPSGEAPAGPFPAWPPQKSRQAKSGNSLINVSVGVLVVLGLIVACFFLFVVSQRPQQTSDGLDPQKQAAYINIGDDGYLSLRNGASDVDGASKVIVAATQDDETKLNDAAVAKDKVGYDNIVYGGGAYLIQNHTRAKLIGYGDGFTGATVYHVRIESGPFQDQDGWIPQEWFKK